MRWGRRRRSGGDHPRLRLPGRLCREPGGEHSVGSLAGHRWCRGIGEKVAQGGRQAVAASQANEALDDVLLGADALLGDEAAGFCEGLERSGGGGHGSRVRIREHSEKR